MFNAHRLKKLTKMLEDHWISDYWKPGVHISYLGNKYYLAVKRYPWDHRQIIIYKVTGSLSYCLKSAIKAVYNIQADPERYYKEYKLGYIEGYKDTKLVEYIQDVLYKRNPSFGQSVNVSKYTNNSYFIGNNGTN